MQEYIHFVKKSHNQYFPMSFYLQQVDTFSAISSTGFPPNWITYPKYDRELPLKL